MDLHFLISHFSYLAIFFLMLTNGAVNFPSSQFLYVICGYLISTTTLMFIPTILVGTIGNTIGNIITFLLIKKYGTSFAQKIMMLEKDRFTAVHNALHTTFSKYGLWYIFVGKIIPSIKAFIPTIAGLADTPNVITSCLFLMASCIWAIALTSVGYYFGKYVTLTSLTGVSLVIGLIVIFFVYRTFSKQMKKELV